MLCSMSSARPICGQVSAFYVVLRGETAGEWAECSQEFARNLVFLCFCILYLSLCIYVLVYLYVVLLVYIFTRGGSGWSEARNLLGI